MPKAEYRNAIRSKQLIHNGVAELLHEKSLEQITVSDMPFYKKLMTSNISSQLQEHIAELVLEYLSTNTSSTHEIDDTTMLNIRFCTGGLINLYQDWFHGKIQISRLLSFCASETCRASVYKSISSTI